MIEKIRLWRGLVLVFAVLLSIAIAAAIVLESFRSQIDNFLGTRSEVIESTDDGTLYSAFTPPEDVLNEDGSGNSQKLIQKFIDYGRRQTSGGAVLLKNGGGGADEALPLASGSSVTLLGLRSHVMIHGAGQGMPIRGPVITLEEALGESRTDFNDPANSASGTFTTLTDYDFEGAGFKLNPTMIENYDTLNETCQQTLTGPWRLTSSGFYSGPYDPKEPSIADIEAVDPDYESSFGEYGDAAIVVIGRPGGENRDYERGGVAEGLGAEEPLELTTNERDIIDKASEHFEKVIVLLNCTSPMEIGELKDNDKVDSVLWVGHPGNYGTLGIADILCGRVSPSGSLYDIYAEKGMSHPAMVNFGDYTLANPESDYTRQASNGGNNAKYVIEAEGIYVGYRYYETRYNDIIEGRGNADSAAGAVASSGNWNYTEEVAYGFGYGMSYSDFTQELVGRPEIEHGAHDFTMTFTVRVTNSASGVPAACNVQLYGQAPYKQNGVEKSAIQLLAYDKTDVLDPGDSETLTIKVDLQNLASYDSTHDNCDGTKGTYILDEGDYYFAIGNGAHDALKNILAAQGKTVANTSGKMDYDGDASKTFEYTYDYAGSGAVDDTTFSVTKAGVKVSNHLEYADWNYFEPGKVTYLSRSDWSGTYPVEYTNMTATDDMLEQINGKLYTIKTDDDTSDIKFGVDHGMHFSEMKFSEFDDPRWDDLLEQMTIEEAMGVVASGGNSFRTIESVGFVEASLTENSGNGMDLQLFQTNAPDAPWTIATENDKSDPNSDYELEVFGCGPLVASSFDPDLQYELGEMVGLQALMVGMPILWGPGLNTHRHPYNGRNSDYYSEDPVLSGGIAMEFAMGALEYGLIAAPKHFAFNDQETNRKGVAPFMTEQRAREVELRAFQIAVEATKYDEIEGKNVGMRGLMCSFSKIGPVECTASRGLMTDILQGEWGFHGYAVTDISDDFDLFTAIAYAGTTGYDVRRGHTPSGFSQYESLADGVTPSPGLYENDATMLEALKHAAHNVLWVFCQSNLMNMYNSTSHAVWQMTWWRGAYISMIVVFGVLAAASAALYVVGSVKKRREVK